MPNTPARTDPPASRPTRPTRGRTLHPRTPHPRTLRTFWNRLSTIIASAHRAGVPF